jgi:hypothetical protein
VRCYRLTRADAFTASFQAKRGGRVLFLDNHLDRGLRTEGFHDLGYHERLIKYVASKFHKTLVQY